MAFVKTEVQGAVEIITIDRPKALNALNPEVLADLKAAFEAVDQETVRCIVLTGEGDKSFVAGADIGSMSTMTKAEGEAFGKLGNDVFLMIESFPIPVIAAVNGFALGGGNELAMSCDIRICSDNAVFGQPEVGLGITPGFGGTQRLARLVGMGMAKQLVYSALNIKADEALRIGLVNAVYPQAELMENVLKLAGKIAKNAPIAVRNCKKAINGGDMAKAQQICDKQQGCVANVVGASIAAYKEMENTPNLKRAAKVAKIQQAHEEATQLEMPTLQMNMPILATIVTLGTLTALFGTVVGMIRSFAALASGGGGDSLQLSEGISEALVNTASGILTSWFAVVAYNYYSNKIDKLTYALDEVGYTIAQTYEANHADEA